MKKIKIVLRIIVLLVILFFVFNYIQGILVNKEKIMDSNNYSYKPIYSNMYLEYLKVNNVFNIITPKVVVIVYIIIQLVLLIIAIKQKNFKQWLKFNIIIFTIIKIINYIFLNFIIDQSNQMNYITDTMYIYEEYESMKVANMVLNIIILVVSVIFNIMLVTKFRKEELEQKLKDRLSIIMYIVIIIFSLLIIFSNLGTRMYVIERDWSFGRTESIRYYSKKIDDIEGNYDFTILDIDEDGILIEYTRGYYVSKGGESLYDQIFNVEYKTKIVQQKLIWNIWYEFSPEKDSMLAVDGGTDYYIKFKK